MGYTARHGDVRQQFVFKHIHVSLQGRTNL